MLLKLFSVIFRVFPNGDELSTGYPINLKQHQMKYGWNILLDQIGDTMQQNVHKLVSESFRHIGGGGGVSYTRCENE